MMNKSQIKFEVLEGHKFGVVEGHIQNIECLVGDKCISNLEIKIIGGSSMTITFPMALPFEKDDKIRAYINMGKYNDLSPIEISYNQLSDKEEAFKIEKIKHWKVASVYRINIEKGI